MFWGKKMNKFFQLLSEDDFEEEKRSVKMQRGEGRVNCWVLQEKGGMGSGKEYCGSIIK